MTEYERKREEIARIEFSHILDAGFPSHSGIPFEKLPDDWWSKVKAYERADQILSLDGIEIRAENHDLPRNRYQPISYHLHLGYQRGQEDMLKPDSEGKHWVKVIS